jgi:hypothetical protein
MLGVVGLGMHVGGGAAGDNGVGFCVSAAFIRMLLAGTYVRIAWHLPRARVHGIANATANTLMALSWIVAAAVPAHMRVWFILVAMLMALSSAPIMVRLVPSKHGLPLHLGTNSTQHTQKHAAPDSSLNPSPG